MSDAGYYRFPTLHEDTIVFACEEDLWTVEATGGVARRLTANPGVASHPALSPDGTRLAFTGRDEGEDEVYVMAAAGGEAIRLTFLGTSSLVRGWTPDGKRIVCASDAGQPFRSLSTLRLIDPDRPGAQPEILPTGPAMGVSFAPDGGLVIGRNLTDIARWKRYRGGRTGDLWVDAEGDGDWRRLITLDGNVAQPLWIGDRIYFVSDHEGVGNLYSCTPGGEDLLRHTDHDDYYVRHPATDGRRIVYHAGADLYLFDPADGSVARVPIALHSPRPRRKRRFVHASSYLQGYALHPEGRAVVINSRGKPFAMDNHDGAVVQLGARDGVRHRLAAWLPDGERVVLIADTDGEEAIEVHRIDGAEEPLRFEELDLGRPVSLVVSPHKDVIALTNHRLELIVVALNGDDTAAQSKTSDEVDANAEKVDDETGREAASGDKPGGGEEAASDEESAPAAGDSDAAAAASGAAASTPTARVLDVSKHDRIRDVAWSPDGRWLAYAYSGTRQTSHIRLCEVATGAVHPATTPVLHDESPAWDPNGRYLYFLSQRDFSPVYDNLHFDLGFPYGTRPHLLTLRADVEDPFTADPRWPGSKPPKQKKDAENEADDTDHDEQDPPIDADDDALPADDEDDNLDEDADDDADGDEEGDGDGENEDEDEDEDGDEDELDDELDNEGVGGAVRIAPPRAAARARVVGFEEDQGDDNGKPARAAKAAGAAGRGRAEAKKRKGKKLRIDLEGITERVIPFPVAEGRYRMMRAAKGSAMFVQTPMPHPAGPPSEEGDTPRPSSGRLLAWDFADRRLDTLADDVDAVVVTPRADWMLLRSGRRLRVVKAGQKPPDKGPPRKSGWLDLSRVRVSVDPAAEWRQMLREAWRLQRDQFWVEDMAGLDWRAVYERYLPLVDRVATRDEFSDLMWEMQGELGTSHAYEYGGDRRSAPRWSLGHLGADLRWDEDAQSWTVASIVAGSPWDPSEGSPLARAGLDVQPGDRLLAIDGRRLGANLSPGEALVHRAGEPVLLTMVRAAADTPADGGDQADSTAETEKADSRADGDARKGVKSKEDRKSAGPSRPETTAADTSDATDPAPSPRTFTVHTLRDERALRYRAWVDANRRWVHEATEGRAGYVHIPDMSARGYAEFHRGFLAEIDREALVVDVRFNGGGHVSPLILEKLARKRLGYDVQRWGAPVPYPTESIMGPLVALTNEGAGSDGDMFSHAFKMMALGPLIGTRTWGGVIGIWPRQALTDGSVTTQPEFSFWFQDVGWGLENYGTDPDIVVEIQPQDHVADQDPQLARGVTEILALLAANPPSVPAFPPAPSRALPRLPGAP